MSTVLIGYGQLRKSNAAAAIRGVYEELIPISEDASIDLERKQIISNFVKEAGNQIKEGFSLFSSKEEKEKKALGNTSQLKTS